jgi:hypothetical protein
VHLAAPALGKWRVLARLGLVGIMQAFLNILLYALLPL